MLNRYVIISKMSKIKTLTKTHKISFFVSNVLCPTLSPSVFSH